MIDLEERDNIVIENLGFAEMENILSLQHCVIFTVPLFTPWQFFTRVIGLLPYIYTVWRKKNIRIGMAVHCSMNLIGCIGMLAAVFLNGGLTTGAGCGRLI